MEVLKLEAKSSKDIPILIAPGWSETCASLKPLATCLRDTLRRNIITLTHPRTGASISKNKKYPQEEWRKANNLKNLLEQEGITKVDVIAHSEGGINSVIAATEFPEYFRQLALITPAGLIGEDSIPELGIRFLTEIINARLLNKSEQESILPFSHFSKESFKYVKGAPIRATKEIAAIANFQTPNLIQQLIKQEINISLIYTDEDKVFPANKIEQATEDIEFKKKLHIAGKHFDVCLYPQNYVELIRECLE